MTMSKSSRKPKRRHSGVGRWLVMIRGAREEIVMTSATIVADWGTSPGIVGSRARVKAEHVITMIAIVLTRNVIIAVNMATLREIVENHVRVKVDVMMIAIMTVVV